MRAAAILMISLLTVSVSFGDCADGTTPSWKRFNQDTAPDELIFWNAVSEVKGFADHGVDHWMLVESVKGGLTDKMSADDVIALFIDLSDQISEEAGRARTEFLCDNGQPRVKGEDMLRAFSAADEVSDAVYRDQLAAARIKLEDTGLFDVSKHITYHREKRQVSIIYVDHVKQHKCRPYDIDQMAEQYCGLQAE